jgi:hypothetical protein
MEDMKKLQERINERKIRLKKEILPKLLKKILSSKLEHHMRTVKFGLMTLR